MRLPISKKCTNIIVQSFLIIFSNYISAFINYHHYVVEQEKITSHLTVSFSFFKDEYHFLLSQLHICGIIYHRCCALSGAGLGGAAGLLLRQLAKLAIGMSRKSFGL